MWSQQRVAWNKFLNAKVNFKASKLPKEILNVTYKSLKKPLPFDIARILHKKMVSQKLPWSLPVLFLQRVNNNKLDFDCDIQSYESFCYLSYVETVISYSI